MMHAAVDARESARRLPAAHTGEGLTQINPATDCAPPTPRKRAKSQLTREPTMRELAKENQNMKHLTPRQLLALSIFGGAVSLASGPALAAVDAASAQALAKKSDCLKCHAVDKTKKAPSYQAIAAKWKGKADAEAKLIDVITKSPKVKLEDGTQEDHKAVSTKDMGEIKNLVGWILTQ
jgi:cytochrome c